VSTLLNSPEVTPVVIRTRPVLDMTEDQFFDLCQINSDWRMERSAEGEIVILPPTGGGSGSRNLRLAAQLSEWAVRDDTGVAFDSSTGFTLPNGAIRSPDASWALKSRLKVIAPAKKEKFLPLCPDFVVEMVSPSDPLSVARKKMEEYMANGARLGWLIDPLRKKAYVYRPGCEVERLESPQHLAGDPELAGFVLKLEPVWDRGF
jgi:Uma2 family endonuclease